MRTGLTSGMAEGPEPPRPAPGVVHSSIFEVVYLSMFVDTPLRWRCRLAM